MDLLVLDRDGVINFDAGYVNRVEDFVFLDGIFEFVREAKRQGAFVCIATNQAGIARGLYSESQFNDLTEWMLEEFTRANASIDAVYHCPHHPDFPAIGTGADCKCRKPLPGMLQMALNQSESDPKLSVMVGDKDSDMIAAVSAGFAVRVKIGEESQYATHNFATVREMADWAKVDRF